MKLHSDQLPHHLKKSLAPIYLISGDEPLLMQEAVDTIKKTATQHHFSEINIVSVDSGFDFSLWLSDIHSGSLFSDRRLVDMRFDKEPNKIAAAALQHYAKLPNKDILLIIRCPKLDVARQKAAWIKEVDKIGVQLAIWPIEQKQLSHWITHRLKEAGLKATPDALPLLIAYTEGNIAACAQAIEKIKLLDQEIVDIDMVETVLCDQAQWSVFQLADSILLGELARAKRILSHLEGEGLDPTLILWAIARELRSLIELLFSKQQGHSLETCYQKQGIWDKRKLAFNKAMQRGSLVQYQRCLSEAATIDRLIKGAESGNPWDALLKLIVNMAGNK